MNYTINSGICQEVLEKTFSSLEAKQRLKSKQLSEYIEASKLADKSDNFIHNYSECGTLIGVDESGKIRQANFCKSRLCPVCAWRKSIQTYIKLRKIVSNMSQHQYIFLTLTQKNCDINSLGAEIDRINYAWKRFKQKAMFKRAYKGYVRAIEVTYNKKEKTFHPHQHIILDVNTGYFDKGSDLYIPHSKIVEIWSSLINQDYCNADIRALKTDTELQQSKSIAELAKYTLKLSEESNPEVLSKLFKFLNNRRCFTYGGTFKKEAKLLKIDLENDDEENDDALNQNITMFRYDNGHYKKL